MPVTEAGVTPRRVARSVVLAGEPVALFVIAAGVTTVHSWAHNTRSPEHADAELSAMRHTGVRGRFAYGPALGMANGEGFKTGKYRFRFVATRRRWLDQGHHVAGEQRPAENTGVYVG